MGGLVSYVDDVLKPHQETKQNPHYYIKIGSDSLEEEAHVPECVCFLFRCCCNVVGDMMTHFHPYPTFTQ